MASSITYQQAGNPTMEKQNSIVAPVPAKNPVPPPAPLTSNSSLPMMVPGQSGKPMTSVQAPPTAPPPAPIAPGQTPAPAPSSYLDIGKANIAADQTKANASANTDLGLTNTFASPTDQFKASIENQRQNNALQEQQMTKQETDLKTSADAAATGSKSGADLIAGQLANNREGIVSGSNAADISQSNYASQQQIARITASKDASLAAVDQARKNLQFATTSGNTDMAKQYQATLDAAESKAKQIDTEYIQTLQSQQTQQLGMAKTLADTGALDNATPQQIQQLAATHGVDPQTLQMISDTKQYNSLSEKQKAKYDQTTKGLTSFTDILKQGSSMTPENIAATAKSLGISTDLALSAYNGYSAIRTDKTLDETQKAAATQNLSYDLQQKAKGIFNEAQRNTQSLSDMYANGTDPKIIAAFKSAAGIADSDDPMRIAEIGIKQAQAVIDTKHANGEAITPQDLSALADYQTKVMDMGGAPQAVIPQGGSIPISVTANGSLSLNVPAGYKAQCGHFVNDCFGKRIVGDSYAQKMSLTDPSIKVPTPGMAFVQKERGPYAASGHIGMITAVYPDGTVDIADANSDGHESYKDATTDPKTHSHVALSTFSGFINPPNSQSITKGDDNDVASMSDKDILSAYESAGKIFEKPSDARKAIVTARQTGFVPGASNSKDGSSNNDFQSLAESLANYDIDPKDLSSRLPKGATDSQRSQLLVMAKKINPNYSEGNFAAKKAYIDSWSGNPSPGTPAFMNDTANTAIKHLGAAYNAFSEIKNSGARDANAVSNYLKDHAGDPAIAAFMAIQEPLAAELGKASTGGVPNESEMANYRKILDVNKSPDAMMATIKAQMELLGGKIKTNVNRYQKTIGSSPKDPVLDDESVTALKAMGLKPEDYDSTLKQQTKGQNNSNTLHGTSQDQVAAPKTHGDFKANIQKMVDGGNHTTDILAELRSNPGTRQWVESAMAGATSSQDYKDILNSYLQQ